MIYLRAARRVLASIYLLTIIHIPADHYKSWPPTHLELIEKSGVVILLPEARVGGHGYSSLFVLSVAVILVLLHV